jgi:hypothetical protein
VKPTDQYPGETAADEPFAETVSEFLCRHVEPLQWIVANLVPVAGLVLVAGAQKSHKTWLGIDLAIAVASGTEFLGRPVLQGPTIYILEEGSPNAIADRYRVITARRGGADVSHIAMRRGLRADDDKSWQRVMDAVARIKPVLIVLDPLIRLHALDENNSVDMARIMARLGALTELGTAVVVIHHIAKRGGDGYASIAGSARGSGAIISATDGNVMVRAIDHDSTSTTLRLSTEMRDCDAETFDIRWLAVDASFSIADPAAASRVARYAGSITVDDLCTLVEQESEEGQGLTAVRLAGLRAVSTETARLALVKANKDGVLTVQNRGGTNVYRLAA